MAEAKTIRRYRVTEEMRERARELRAQGLKLKVIKDLLAAEGMNTSVPTLSQITSDVECKENRGRERIYTREETLAKKRSWAKEHYKRWKAKETPEEREDRLAFKRFMYQINKDKDVN